MTYHTRTLLRLVPGAIVLAFIAYGWLLMFEVLGMIINALQGS